MFFDTKSRPNKFKISICLIIMQFFDRFCGLIRGNDFFSFFFQYFTTKEIFGCKPERRTKDEENQRTVRPFDFIAVDLFSPLYAGVWNGVAGAGGDFRDES